MDLKQPPQYYWTTLFDQYQPSQSLSFAFVPFRSFVNNKVPGLDVIASMFDAQALGSSHSAVAPADSLGRAPSGWRFATESV